MKEERRGSINRTEISMRIFMVWADENKKGVLDVAMSSRRERRLNHKLSESHQVGEGLSVHNNMEVINDFCKHYHSVLENLGRIDEDTAEGKPVEGLIDELMGTLDSETMSTLDTLDPTSQKYMQVTLVPNINKMH